MRTHARTSESPVCQTRGNAMLHMIPLRSNGKPAADFSTGGGVGNRGPQTQLLNASAENKLCRPSPRPRSTPNDHFKRPNCNFTPPETAFCNI